MNTKVYYKAKIRFYRFNNSVEELERVWNDTSIRSFQIRLTKYIRDMFKTPSPYDFAEVKISVLNDKSKVSRYYIRSFSPTGSSRWGIGLTTSLF